MVSRESFLLVVCCSHPPLGCRCHGQAEGMDPGGVAPRSVYSQPSLCYPARQGSQTLSMAAGLAPALGGKRRSRNVPEGSGEMIHTEIITFYKCTLMPKDPREVGTTKFLSEIFSDGSTRAQATSEPGDLQVTWPVLWDGSSFSFQL